jgi:ubiquinone/menaquinone biosynthesis C-methylase UbiE
MILDDTRPDPIAYLDQTAASAAGAAYKRDLLVALDLRPGHTVLDIGCGPGTDLPDLAANVHEAGTVIGVDLSPTMVDEAYRRLAAWPNVRVRVGDAHDLPLPDRTIDRARADRVLHQVSDPARVLAEIRRVLRPGGLAALAQPDYDTLAVDPGGVEINRALNRFVCKEIVPHATIGRQLPRLALDAGLDVRAVRTSAPVFRDFAVADLILGLRRNATRAVDAGQLDRSEAEHWLTDLTTKPFLATFILFTVIVSSR